MAQFYGIIQGSRGEASRLGTRKSGLIARGNGWCIGASIFMFNDAGEDKCRLSLTSGSSNNGIEVALGIFTREDLEVLRSLDARKTIRAMIDNYKK